MKVNRLQTLEVELALDWICATVNFDFSKQLPPPTSKSLAPLRQYLESQPLNTKRGFATAAHIVDSVKRMLDPIIEAHTANASAVEHEEKLVNELNRSVTSWRLERNLVDGKLGDRWEVKYTYKAPTLRDFLIAQAGLLLRYNAIDKLRRCRNCGKYIRHSGGRLPAFCDRSCRNTFNNRKNLIDDRLVRRVRNLVELAQADPFDLTDTDKRHIEHWLGTNAFRQLSTQLAALEPNDESAFRAFFQELPEGIRDRLAIARPRKRAAEKPEPESHKFVPLNRRRHRRQKRGRSSRRTKMGAAETD